MTLNFTAKFELRNWAEDIKSFENWKRLFEKYQSEFAMERMIAIRRKWPNHQKQMVLPEPKGKT